MSSSSYTRNYLSHLVKPNTSRLQSRRLWYQLIYLGGMNGSSLVKAKTWLNDANVEDLLDVSAVGRDLEHGTRLVLDARDVDRNDIVGHAAPAYVSVLLLHLEYLGPQPAPNHHRRHDSLSSFSLGHLEQWRLQAFVEGSSAPDLASFFFFFPLHFSTHIPPHVYLGPRTRLRAYNGPIGICLI